MRLRQLPDFQVEPPSLPLLLQAGAAACRDGATIARCRGAPSQRLPFAVVDAMPPVFRRFDGAVGASQDFRVQ